MNDSIIFFLLCVVFALLALMNVQILELHTHIHEIGESLDELQAGINTLLERELAKGKE